MKHYICTGGCGGVSESPGVCQANVCVKKGHSLIECDCADGKHGGKISACVHCGKLCGLSGGCDLSRVESREVEPRPGTTNSNS
ncbi:hypothetical protein A3A09_00070 [Candidatus Nomurabacteria bacterium RIFCSPLOWO2_01_FULL_42_20]|uniref:Uncharacterized protein n=1 Tax=Candidatus Nomurabacteria bacterium RIFCSPHIGHO2_01_FULL_42_16 TaxID=1801743 RepID=A0A1F6VIT0_9BACT|nr:MAG: hypothetical protein A2824_03420 [Candidatus Nomurabacteria bacterium RIFCSPHIGHO2_01_FULL_42_16]OGI91196.1 MAG: hypothetical protein A3A09_00070 [Candidatus Nomurabacteria bacterium RIFCSPLOWO2_01_FULL_42_20]